MRAPGAEGLTIKAALLLGFGLTLGLWVWAGYDVTRRMAEVERRSAAINVRYMEAQELLASVRPQVLLVSVNVRNALLDYGLANLDEYRRRIGRTLEAVDHTLQRYVPVFDSIDERERVQRLRAEIDRFGEAILLVMSSASDRSPAETRAQLARVTPRRDLVIRVTEETQALNRAAFVQQQAAIATAYRRAQRDVWQQLGVSLSASLAIAILATVYVGRLEQGLRRQREQQALNARDLQRLSAKLIHAQEEERRTIARELHDEVGQVLTAMKVELTLAENKLTGSGFDHLLNDVQSIADGALHTVRDLSHLLHPALLDDLGLAAAVEWYIDGFARRYGVAVSLRQDGMADRLPPQIEIAAFRIVQEALTNVARHARAQRCQVALRREPAALFISVEDDGVGFDLTEVARPGAHRGFGLLGLRERVWQLLGTIRVESQPGRGTLLRVELPILAPPKPDRDAAGPDAIVAGDMGTETAGG